MARKTTRYTKIPWNGGINTAVDPGMLNDNDLVVADNVVFSSSGSRLKREGLDYFDSDIPVPNARSSSGTTRTLYFSDPTNMLQVVTPATDDKLVSSEYISVVSSGADTTYNVTATPILTLTEVAEVTTVTCVADSSGSLNNKYFLIQAGRNGTTYYVWFNVNSAGVDPALSGKTAVPITLSTNATAGTVATAVASALDALDAFAASAVSTVVTVTASTTGPATDAVDTGLTGFTLAVTTQGAHIITYTGGSSLTESKTTTTTLTVSRSSSILALKDYWRFTSPTKTQRLISATDNFKLYSYDSAGRRTEIAGQVQVTTVTCPEASTITTGDYWYLYSANGVTNYYIWYDKASGGGDPAVAGKTAVPVAIGSGDTAAQVATATQLAIDALALFSATVDTATVTISNSTAGITTTAADVNAGVTIAVTASGATLPTTAVEKFDTRVLNNRFICAMTGLGNKPIKYYPESAATYQLLGGTPPDFSIMTEFQGRLWTNDKTDLDRLHYSSTQDPEIWNGAGDSGALDIARGDNDPSGITGIFPFKGILFVQKRQRLFRVVGTAPENYKIEPVSSGIGGESHTANVAVDQDDVMFLSKRGFHSVSATSNYGDTEAAFLSKKIQPTFNEWNQGTLSNTQGVYVPELNSVAYAVSQNSEENDNVWLFDINLKEWYRWPDISCTALSSRLESNKNKLVFGTNAGRVVQAQNGAYSDFASEGIAYRIKTGTIYPGNDANSVKAFKSIGLLYKPKGNFLFTLNVKIDNYPVQALVFQQETGGDRLDVDFILGQSILGSSSVLAPYTQQIDGHGRGLTLEILQSGTDEQVEIYGFIIEYTQASDSQETIGSNEESD